MATTDTPANPTSPVIGGFTPHAVTVPWKPPSVIADTGIRVSAAQASLLQFLKDHQNVNKGFDLGTSGDPTYLTGVADQTITRGFIRRASPSSSDPISMAQLNFMYNPESVVRDYVSYLDQEALDPFNTVYGSGNLIAPPSFINFSFSLFFDRQTQTAQGVTPNGVIEDYNFFDIVVRNVAPGGAATAVPDNGIMMVNPKDITVVFSQDLTVQGRPTNASVAFEKFNSKMTPTRMTINLTMIVTYFGPLRDAFTLDTSQAIEQWKALIPYSDVYKEDFTQEQADAAQSAFNQNRDAVKSFVDALRAGANAGVVGGAVAGVAGAASSDLAAKTLQFGKDNIIAGRTVYTQGAGRANLTASADCSGALWCCYNAFGASQILHGSSGPANTSSIAANLPRGTMAVVCDPRSASLAQLTSLLRPGDVVLRVGGSNHCGMFDSWSNAATGEWMLVHQTSGGSNGHVRRTLSYLKTFTHVLRPVPSGASTSTGVW